MARRRILIHVGMPKCGSTGLQFALASNRSELLAAGIHFPPGDPTRTDGLQQMSLVGDLVAASKRATGPSAMLAETIAGFDRSGAARMILSSESFAIRAHRIEPFAIGDLLRPFAVELLLFIRRRDHWLLSFYKQCVRVAPRLYRGSFEQFLANPPPYAGHIEGAMQAKAAIRLERLTGAQAVHVVDLDASGGDTRAAAGRLIDYPVETLPADPAILPNYYATLARHGLPANASLSDAKTAFLAAVDRTGFDAAMLLDLDTALALTPMDDIAPDFVLLDQATSVRLIAAGMADRRRLNHRYGVDLPDAEPVATQRSDPLTPTAWCAMRDRIADRLQPRTRAALDTAGRDL